MALHIEETADYALARTSEGWEVTWKRHGNEKSVHPTCHDAEHAVHRYGYRTPEEVAQLSGPPVSMGAAVSAALAEQVAS